VITQVNNRIIFIFGLGSGKVSKFRAVAALTDRRHIQNYSSVLVWIVCWSHITRRAGTSLWGTTLPHRGFGSSLGTVCHNCKAPEEIKRPQPKTAAELDAFPPAILDKAFKGDL
jgi:hypothetical protein